MDGKRVSKALALIAAATLGTAAQADTGLYLGAGVGAATVDEDFSGFDIDDDVEAYRVLGGLQLGDTLGIEVGYQNFGDFEERFDLGGVTSVTRLTADGWTLGGTLGLPLTDSISIFGRAGIFVWDADVEVNGVRSAVDDDSNPYYGVGGKVGFTDRFSLVGDWSRFELDETDLDVVSLGFEYRFGG